MPLMANGPPKRQCIRLVSPRGSHVRSIMLSNVSTASHRLSLAGSSQLSAR